MSISHEDVMFIPSAPRKRAVSLDDFDIGKQLGEGKYGQVFLARDKTTNMLVAIKKLEILQLLEENVVNQVQRELKIMQTLKHRHILSMYTYFWDKESIYIVLEYAEGGDLWRQMYKEKRFSAHKTAQYVAQLCEAIDHAHKHKVLHRDIKPENILIDSKGDIKLADFGWSVQDQKMQRDTYCGTPDYIPPEMLGPEGAGDNERFEYTHKIDNWCIGVFMYECLCGDAPFFAEKDDERNRKIRAQEFNFQKAPSSIPHEAKQLVKKLLRGDPNRRADLTEVLNDPFIVKYYYNHKRIPVPVSSPSAEAP